MASSDGRKRLDGKRGEGESDPVYCSPGARPSALKTGPVGNARPENTFQTPQLRPGQEYFYELRAEVMREGNDLYVEWKLCRALPS